VRVDAFWRLKTIKRESATCGGGAKVQSLGGKDTMDDKRVKTTKSRTMGPAPTKKALLE